MVWNSLSNDPPSSAAMKHDLVGYLMGAIDPHERQQIDEAMRHDPGIAVELDRIRGAISPLDRISVQSQPPPRDLIQRTIAGLDQSVDIKRNFDPTRISLGNPLTQRVIAGLSPISPERAGWRRFSATDYAWLAAAAAIVLALSIPGLHRWRESTRQIACMDHLRLLGTKLTQFVTRDPLGQLPGIAAQGPASFAGIYSVRLHESGLLDDPSLRWCPANELPRASNYKATNPLQVASLKTVMSADVNPLREIQQSSGGHYAYNLGVRDGKNYGAPRFESRTSFAVLSDSPDTSIQHENRSYSGPHGGGINVLYEDGSVTFLSTLDIEDLPDHPLHNQEGRLEAGLTIDDASLAPSWRAPFIGTLQR